MKKYFGNSGRTLALFLLFILEFFICSDFAHAQGGGEGSKGGGGGDVIVRKWTDGAQWFTQSAGHDTIRYCLQLSKHFSLTAEEVSVKVERSFRAWVNYRQERFLSRSTDPALELERQSKCNTNTDLVIYLGVENARVRKAKAQYQNPYSLAERTQIGQQFWGKGFFWLANPGTVRLTDETIYFPDWKNVDHQLYAALLHEWGHVFGCDHLEKTIMREDLVRILIDTAKEDELGNHRILRTRIDHGYEVARWYSPTVSFTSQIDPFTRSHLIQLFGLKFTPKSLRMQLKMGNYLVLTFISEEEEETTEPVFLSMDRSGSTGSIFRPPFYAPGSIMGQYSFQSYGKFKGGAQIALDYNVAPTYYERAPWRLSVIEDGRKVEIADFRDMQ